MAFGLLFGVIIFSVIMGKYADIIERVKAFEETADDSGELSRFFGILSKYNQYKRYNPKSKAEIEAYFDHRWETHKNVLIFEGEGAGFFSQLS
jgi:hypothetical protein